MSDKVHKKIETWIQANISVEELGKYLLSGLEATKISNKEEVPDFGARLSYIDWIATNGGYVAEKKVTGGTFQMGAPAQGEIKKVFGESRPADE
jgi:hypothetical protein